MTYDTKHRQPSKHAKQLVHDAFEPDILKHLCETWDFSDYADYVDLEPNRFGDERFYWHKDNGSNILAVAHLDTVQDNRACQITHTAAGLLATSGGLDDRLGVYTILELLPALGITCDWLLTTDEEIGQSTADEFSTDKDYHWMFQFDRAGTDVVMYKYETPELCEAVEQSGSHVGVGIWSDICSLDFLGCAGFNWGVGYQDYHSERSHAWLTDTFRQVARFVKFYNANVDKTFAYEPRFTYGGYGYDEPICGTLVADCGHDVELDDESTYLEMEDGDIVCTACGTMS